MKKNWLALTLGILLFFTGCLMVVFGLNKHWLGQKFYYSIGKVIDFKGEVLKQTDLDTKKSQVTFNDKIYSNHKYYLKKDSYVEMEINTQTLNIVGPAVFTFNVLSSKSKTVFINFNEFTEILPKDFKSENINLTYKGWTIEAFFDPVKDLENSEKRNLKGLNSFEELGDEVVSEEPLPLLEEEKSSYIEEIISIKRPLLKKCYENYLQDNPMSTGSLMVEFTLSTSGRVSSAKVKDSSFFRSESFKLCIVNVFKQIRSRPFSGDHIQVTYPIEFM